MSFKKRLRSFDDILRIVTGKRMKNIAGAALNSFGEELTKKVSKKVAEFFAAPEETLPSDSPYRVLDIYPDADDFVVRAAYIGLMKKYHPDSGKQPDAEMAKKINDAYDRICAEREMPK